MHRSKILLLSVVIIFTLVVSNIQVHSQPHWDFDNYQIVGSNIVISFINKQPSYTITHPKFEQIAYYIQFVQLIEFQDKNNNFSFDANDRILARGILCDKFAWNIKANETENALIVALSSEIRVVKMGAHYGPPLSAHVSFVNRMFFEDTAVGDYQIKGESDLKIDIIIRDWPWQKDDSYLALMVNLQSYDIKHGGTKLSTITQHKKEKYGKTEMAEFTLKATESSYGISFKNSYSVNIDNAVSECTTSLSENKTLYINYPHFDEILIHDPVISIISSIEEKIGFFGIIVGATTLVFALMIAVYSIRRVKRKLFVERSNV